MVMGAVSTVLRVEHANFIAAKCKFIPFAGDVVKNEGMAMRDGLELDNCLGFNHLEADLTLFSIQVTNFCTETVQMVGCRHGAAIIFAECVDVSVLIGKVKFRHCFRNSNQVAHVLANYSFCNKTSSTWKNEPSGCLISKLMDDVISI